MGANHALGGGRAPGVAGSAGVSGTRRGACFLCRLPAPPLVFFPAPIPPPALAERSSRREGGDYKFISPGAVAPGTPGIKPPAALTEPAKQVPCGGLCLLRGGVEVAFRYLAGRAFGVASLVQNRQEAVPYEQSRQPRRGGTGGEELRRLRWSSPPGQVEQVPQGANCSPGTTAAGIASAARVQPPCGHHSGRVRQCRAGSAPLRAPQRQG